MISCLALKAQVDTGFRLSEEVSKQIIESPEYQNCIRFQNDFLDIISNKVNQGTSIESIKTATLNAIRTSNYNEIYLLLFGNYQSAEVFFTGMANSQRSYISNLKTNYPNMPSLGCSTCHSFLTDDVNYFFRNFNVFNTNRMPVSGGTSEGVAPEPTCGSYWNQVLLAACATGCSVTTAGLGVAMCGWGCWCTFCTRNSAVAAAICAH